MGMPGPMQLLLILAIVIVIFGAKRLKNIGSDLGGAVKGFKTAVKDETEEGTAALEDAKETVEDTVVRKNDENKV